MFLTRSSVPEDIHSYSSPSTVSYHYSTPELTGKMLNFGCAVSGKNSQRQFLSPIFFLCIHILLLFIVHC